jgi:uncharacterized protein YcbK (DUF882 family)
VKYFKMFEFSCHHCGGLPKGGMNPVLLEKLDQLRGMVGHPIEVSSGYRCPEHNRRIGGVDDSQHVLGSAADIYCDYITTEKLAEYAEQVGFDGIGIYIEDGFVHVDCRCDGRKPNYYRW